MADTSGAKGWALTMMRTGYAGRALTYAAVAGLSLWAIWRGGEAQGTGEAMSALSDTAWGTAVVAGIAVGLIAYALWRLVDAAFDFERYGTDGEGIVARLGMIVTGLVHGALGVAAAGVLSGSGGGGEGGVAAAVETVLGWPGGRWIVGLAGLATLGAGGYYAKKAWKREYRQHLMANEFTQRWDWVLRAGVAAQAVVVAIAGGLLVVAAYQYDGDEAGGIGRVFEWLSQQPFGNVLVVLLCIGLLGFGIFCLVNAAYRIIPALHDEDDMPKTLGQSLKELAA